MAFINQGEFEAVKTLSGWEAARCDEHPYRAKIKVSACSGVARTSPLLGHSMVPGAKCRSLWGWGHPPPENLEILQPPRSVLEPYTVAMCKLLTTNSRMMSV